MTQSEIFALVLDTSRDYGPEVAAIRMEVDFLAIECAPPACKRALEREEVRRALTKVALQTPAETYRRMFA